MIFTFVEVGGLLIIIIGFSFGSISDTNYFEMPKMPYSSHSALISALFGSTVIVFFAYYGFENISNISEETKNPTRVIPRALIVSIIVTTIIYMLVAISSISLVGWSELAKSDTPLAFAASRVLGNNGEIVLTILALIATTNTVLMVLISGSRIIFGIAKYDETIPPILADVHSNKKTPWLAIIFTTAFTSAMIILYSGRITEIVGISVFSIMIVFALVNLAVITLRFKRPDISRPFTSPFRIKKFPILPGLGLVMTVVIIFQLTSQVIFSTIVPVISIIILCLILTKRAKELNPNNRF